MASEARNDSCLCEAYGSLAGGGEKSTIKITLTNMCLQTKMSVLKEGSTRIAPGSHLDWEAQKTF